jgi:DNA (cytosine-5)-methyltransferase 1
MNRPRILDLFCGAGGAAMGYHRSGFDVVGIDIYPQPRYPFAFTQADAIVILDRMLNGWPFVANDSMECYSLDDFAAIHASPPCQRYSQATNMHDKTKHPDLIPQTRELLKETGLPYVIENVPGAPLLDPVLYCGSMFGLERLRRHRLFETNWPLTGEQCDHTFQRDLLSVTGHGEGGSHRGGTKRGPWWGQAERRKAMGAEWMNRTELAESIPPVFTEHVGRQLLGHIQNVLDHLIDKAAA